MKKGCLTCVMHRAIDDHTTFCEKHGVMTSKYQTCEDYRPLGHSKITLRAFMTPLKHMSPRAYVYVRRGSDVLYAGRYEDFYRSACWERNTMAFVSGFSFTSLSLCDPDLETLVVDLREQ